MCVGGGGGGEGGMEERVVSNIIVALFPIEFCKCYLSFNLKSPIVWEVRTSLGREFQTLMVSVKFAHPIYH